MQLSLDLSRWHFKRTRVSGSHAVCSLPAAHLTFQLWIFYALYEAASTCTRCYPAVGVAGSDRFHMFSCCRSRRRCRLSRCLMLWKISQQLHWEMTAGKWKNCEANRDCLALFICFYDEGRVRGRGEAWGGELHSALALSSNSLNWLSRIINGTH